MNGEIGPRLARMISIDRIPSNCALVSSFITPDTKIYPLSQHGKDYIKKCILSDTHQLEYLRKENVLELLNE